MAPNLISDNPNGVQVGNVPPLVRQRSILFHMPKNPPLNVEFENLSLNVNIGVSKVKRQILHGISGRFLSGELTAIMGPSGAGKSSLLNILTGFQKLGVKGEINKVDFKNIRHDYRKESCYINQEDHLSPLFTVDEIMNYAAQLKLGNNLSKKGRNIVIFEILEALNLLVCRHTRCGKLSGGQKRRLSIALELIDNPPVMFLDEPTTGLDSLASEQCVLLLKALAKGGRTIVCTIHQPSAHLYEQFDHVYVLAKGHCVYQGSPLNTVSYLASNNLHCPKYHNPADFLLEVANDDYGDYTEKLTNSINMVCWRKEPVFKESTVKNISRANSKFQMSQQNEIEKAMVLINTPSEFTRFFILLRRTFKQLYRDWTITQLRFLIHMLTAVFVSYFFLNMGQNGAKIVSNMGFFIVSLTYISYTTMMPALLKYPMEVAIVKKENFNNWYSLKTYYLASLLANLPLQILFSFTFGSVSYYLTNQISDWFRFHMYIAALTLVVLSFDSLGLLFGVIVREISNGTFFGAVLTAYMLVFSGYAILYSHMSTFMYYLSFTSYFRYGFEAMVLAVYSYDRPPLDCPQETLYCHYRYPNILMKEMGINLDGYWTNLTVLFVNIVVLRIAIYFALKRRIKQN